jgi:hypothetical protein
LFGQNSPSSSTAAKAVKGGFMPFMPAPLFMFNSYFPWKIRRKKERKSCWSLSSPWRWYHVCLDHSVDKLGLGKSSKRQEVDFLCELNKSLLKFRLNDFWWQLIVRIKGTKREGLMKEMSAKNNDCQSNRFPFLTNILSFQLLRSWPKAHSVNGKLCLLIRAQSCKMFGNCAVLQHSKKTFCRDVLQS